MKMVDRVVNAMKDKGWSIQVISIRTGIESEKLRSGKMTEKEEIEKLKNRIKELEEKAKRKQVNSALQFFKKNKIVDLLGSPEKLKEFTT